MRGRTRLIEENRLVGIVTPEGTWEYVYDALGNRVATIENGERTDYLLDPTGLVDVVAEYDAAGSLAAQYTHGLGLVSMMDGGGDPSYYAFDALGSTSTLTDDDGDLLNAYVFDPYGVSLFDQESLTNSFGYVGQYGVMEDAEDLVFMRARFYDSNLGRFVAEDPIGFGGGDALLYRYASGNPVQVIDPLGLVGSEEEMRRSRCEIKCFLHRDKEICVSKCMGTGETSTPKWADPEKISYAFCDSLFSKVMRYASTAFGFTTPAPCKLREIAHKLGPETSPVPPPGGGGGGGAGSGGSRDPNEKTGPAGYGDAGYVRSDGVFDYRIDFENDASASAPAQVVQIVDQLSPDLDWSTFELTEIGFGDVMIEVPSGYHHYATSVLTDVTGREIEVSIEVGLRPDTGELTVLFYCTDPVTGLPPEITHGFLPPEDGTGCGMGHIGYLIEPMPGLPSGTEIRNIAEITFDFGETIATDQVDPHDPNEGTDPAKEALVTIDAGTPTSTVDPLPSNPGLVNGVTVSWTGEDEANGSGVRGYDIYVREDASEEYTLWLANTTETSAVFTGSPGVETTYHFYSVATDNVGHREPVPVGTSGDASVTFTQTLAGDLNGDGFVGSADLDLIRSRWYETVPPGDLSQGDPSGDGFVGAADLDLVRANWNSGVSTVPGDLNGDGQVSSADLDIIRANWGATVGIGDLMHGDASGDGVVGSADLDIVRANWGAEYEDPTEPGDLNSDGTVGSADLDTVRSHWGETVPAGSLIDGDPSGDGYVGSADLDIVRGNWAAGTPTAASASLPTPDTNPNSREQGLVYGPLPKRQTSPATLNDAALEAWDAAEAAWMEALESLESKRESKAKTSGRQSAVDLVLEGMVE